MAGVGRRRFVFWLVFIKRARRTGARAARVLEIPPFALINPAPEHARSLEVSGFSLPARYRQTFRADFFEGLSHELLLPATCFLDKNVAEKEPLVDLQIRRHK